MSAIIEAKAYSYMTRDEYIESRLIGDERIAAHQRELVKQLIEQILPLVTFTTQEDKTNLTVIISGRITVTKSNTPDDVILKELALMEQKKDQRYQRRDTPTGSLKFW